MKTKILLLLLIIGLASLSFMGCDEGSSPENPLIRYISDGDYAYMAIGTLMSDSTYTFNSSWVYSAGSPSAYTSFEPGTYFILFDNDSSHSTFDTKSTNMQSFESDTKYTLYLSSNGTFNISTD